MKHSKELFQYGDIISVRSDTFISKGIRFFMKLYRKQVPQFSHNAVVINVWNELWVAEALAWGTRVYPIEDSGYLNNSEFVILRDFRGFTEDQIDRMSKKMVSYGGVRYQYENLPAWIAKIVANINLFKSEDDTAIYCSELAAIAINEVYPGTFKTPNMVNPTDHMKSWNYNIIDPNQLLQ